MITIEKKIPIPRYEPKNGGARRKGETKYPFAVMEVGDSFFIEAKGDVEIRRVKSNMNTQALSSKKKNPSRFNWKYLILEVEGGVRIWREE